MYVTEIFNDDTAVNPRIVPKPPRRSGSHLEPVDEDSRRSSGIRSSQRRRGSGNGNENGSAAGEGQDEDEEGEEVVSSFDRERAEDFVKSVVTSCLEKSSRIEHEEERRVSKSREWDY